MADQAREKIAQLIEELAARPEVLADPAVARRLQRLANEVRAAKRPPPRPRPGGPPRPGR